MINRLFNKLDCYTDYNNHYSLNKALKILHNEFTLAVKNKNADYGRVVMDATHKLLDKLTGTYRESQDYGETMSYAQKIMTRKIKDFILYLSKTIKTEFGLTHETSEIEQTINM